MDDSNFWDKTSMPQGDIYEGIKSTMKRQEQEQKSRQERLQQRRQTVQPSNYMPTAIEMQERLQRTENSKVHGISAQSPVHMEKSPSTRQPYSPDRIPTFDYGEVELSKSRNSMIPKDISDKNLNGLIDKLNKKRDLSGLAKAEYKQLRNIKRERHGSTLVSPRTTFK